MKRSWVIALLAACTQSDPGAGDDASPICGDGTCNVGETKELCPDDCALCGDGTCNVGETRESCPIDCARCGDLVCSPNEAHDACPIDCGACGDGVCDHGETLETCAADCSTCGDAMCTGIETVASCPHDCSVCGDAVCSGDETSTSCAQDCASALKVQNNSSTTIFHLYVWRCADSNLGVDQLGATVIAPNNFFLIQGIPPDCYNMRAENSSSSLFWTRTNTNLLPGQTFTWTIVN